MCTILVADDDLTVRRMLQRVLEDAGYDVALAADGVEACHLATSGHISAAIVDVLMPERDGLEVIGWLRRSRPETRIIAISGGGRLGADGYLDIARRLGADRVLRKPMRAAALLAALSELTPAVPAVA
jgi:CheY-like chemotaxis protein